MAATKRRYSKEEFARRGSAIFENEVRPKLKKRDAEKFVAIDIETGEYELGADELAASDKMLARVPDAQIWLVQAGTGILHRFGARTMCDR